MLTSSGRWFPLRTSLQDRPDPGQLIAHQHAVWNVIKVEDTPLTDEERDLWIDRGMPDPGTWSGRPYKLTVEWIGGATPPWSTGDTDNRRTGAMRIPAGSHITWRVYEDGRWPQCSCCGEPMPCRAELEDRQVSRSLDRIAQLEAIPPGACWACAEPITRRQKTVTYPGENLDLPGGQQPHFHTRAQCRPAAGRYEERWLAADPRRERIITWPSCDGILVVHADGSSECVSGHGIMGEARESQADCRGHLTHDHRAVQACYVGDDLLRSSEWDGDVRSGDLRWPSTLRSSSLRPTAATPTRASRASAAPTTSTLSCTGSCGSG